MTQAESVIDVENDLQWKVDTISWLDSATLKMDPDEVEQMSIGDAVMDGFSIMGNEKWLTTNTLAWGTEIERLLKHVLGNSQPLSGLTDC